MAINFDRLIGHIERIAPPSMAEEWDNNGVQLRLADGDVRRALVALEITDAVIDEAEMMNADMLVTHHPLIFRKLKSVSCRDLTGRHVIRLVKAGVSVYAAHTSFDAVYGGNNDYLAELLGLQKIRRAQPRKESPDTPILGRIGDLKSETPFAEVCELVRRRLGVGRAMPVVGDAGAPIRKVALCTGGGGDLIEDALRNGCSLFITSDVRHHEALFARENGLCVIDAGHYHTEALFVPNFAGKLKAAVGDLLEVYESARGEAPFRLG
ncbi:MAG: Nif3-like dinuclear metal center hexameric protein [Clostridiales Family XIII bacterium]|jgi:dinuclear metal center YbgI/SA1388 family protein|nr:Nif3-like dinuclear metal center hexameric protein [Clostridiales Family XIII bacterium]